MRFTKLEGAGNDFVCVETRSGEALEDPSALARHVCDRRRGVGADGLLVLGPSDVASARMTVWNADGSLADMCGNALRCSALVLHMNGAADELDIETDSGVLEATVLSRDGTEGSVRTGLGRPESVVRTVLEVEERSMEVDTLRVGNPVCVLWTDSLEEAPVSHLGPRLAAHPFFPAGTNVAFAQRMGADKVRQRTWERGCGETMACGTGAAAVCVSGAMSGRTGRAVDVSLPGGTLQVEWRDGDDQLLLTGPARVVFRGDATWR